MKLWMILNRAIVGWQMILRGLPGWHSQFIISAAGLAAALLVFVFMAFLVMAAASMNISMPPEGVGVLIALFVLALPVIALVVTLMTTRRFLNSQVPILPALVPGVYAMSAFLLFEGLLAMIGGPIVMLAWLGASYLLFRLARIALAWNIGVAAGFAVLTVVMLVAMRLAIYMLPTPSL
ncbi:MAG: hypothetical protein MO846_04925 [Candidatus Devosia symbiotica]|nr:hypothetical protein [Candidatus Devosia symbiotica]